MFRKLSIVIASLALVCPLALGTTQSVSAKAHRPVTTKVVKRSRKHLIRYGKDNMSNRHYPTPEANAISNIEYDKKMLNTKRGRYYLGLEQNLKQNERALKTLRTTKKSAKLNASIKYPFKPIHMKKALIYSSRYWNQNRWATVAPRKGIRVVHYKVEDPHVDNKLLGTKFLKYGTKVLVCKTAQGFIVTNKSMPIKNGSYWEFDA